MRHRQKREEALCFPACPLSFRGPHRGQNLPPTLIRLAVPKLCVRFAKGCLGCLISQGPPSRLWTRRCTQNCK